VSTADTRRPAARRALVSLTAATLIGVAWVRLGPPTQATNKTQEAAAPAQIDEGAIDIDCSIGLKGLSNGEVRSDGVHLAVTAPDKGGVLFARYPGDGPYDDGIVGLDAGINHLVLDGPPGDWRIGCFASPFDANLVSSTDMSTLTVTDSEGYYAKASLSCSDPSSDTISPLSAGLAKNSTASFKEEIVQDVSGLRQSDSLVPAFYADSQSYDAISIQREGSTIALIVRRYPHGEMADSLIEMLPFTLTQCTSALGLAAS
jgi:hypothetical protein